MFDPDSAIIAPETSIVTELDELRPKGPVANLSRNQRFLLIERAFVGLYRWYIDRSQRTRNWNPDTTFDWRNFRKDHSPEVNRILEGFYAVEQYVPDYVTKLLVVIRRSYGRSQFHLRWGSEEEKHSDLWRNAVLFSGHRSPEWVEEYGDTLRGQEWHLPWDDPVHMIMYTVFQERATQLNYVNLGIAAKGQSEVKEMADAADPVLVECCKHIAVDEAAHYNFFLEGARLFMYYFPEDSIQAIIDVLRHFSMPAGKLIPNYDKLAEVLHRCSIYGPRQHSKDVVRAALGQLGAESLKSVEEGIRRSREVPDPEGNTVQSSIFETLNFEFIETKVMRLFDKIQEFEKQVGLDTILNTHFQINPDFQKFQAEKG